MESCAVLPILLLVAVVLVLGMAFLGALFILISSIADLKSIREERRWRR